METKQVYLPPQFTIFDKLFDNPIRQLLAPEFFGQVEVYNKNPKEDFPFLIKHTNRQLLIINKNADSVYSGDVDGVLQISASSFPTIETEMRSKTKWLNPTSLKITDEDVSQKDKRCKSIQSSWNRRFVFQEELINNSQIVEEGLRPPQIGALHATLAHWKITNEPATIVMPTGTGKTETMLALLVSQRLPRLMVVVPSVALREQIADKFITLGLLKRFGVVGEDCLYPVVGVLEHRLKTADKVESFFQCCNVVVVNMAVISGCSDEIQRKMAELCSHLFIDEAHHITAPTWENFRRFFLEKPILQFTATPFRRDNKYISGKVIFNYPLRKAQEEGYFKPINFISLYEYNSRQADEKIALAAIKALEKDLNDGLNHIMMARCEKIERAEEVYKIYNQFSNKHSPLLIHSNKSETEKKAVLSSLREGKSKIIVCVDMFGEGFDLPQLKIAALHDMHKSLAVTLQFVGRFTRVKDGIGNATVIANIADTDVQESLRDLYAEDADWNFLLRRLSEGATSRQVKRSQFLSNFHDVLGEIPLQNILPKMSTVVYRTKSATWWPEKISYAIKGSPLYSKLAINQQDKVAVFVACERELITWGDIKGIFNTFYHLYLVHWDVHQNLLFINSSNNETMHEDLAKVVAGNDVELIRGDNIFRCLFDINRLTLLNFGLSSVVSRTVKFTMHMGSNVQDGLSEGQVHNKRKVNIFVRGFENGDRASIGCSVKGRIWSHKAADDISEWVEWCRPVGAKLLNDSIVNEVIFKSIMVPEPIKKRPFLIPIIIEWSEAFIFCDEDSISLEIDDSVVPFFDLGMELIDYTKDQPLKFRVFSGKKTAEYKIEFKDSSVEYVPVGEERVYLLKAKKRKKLSQWFQLHPPVIRFEDGTFLIYNELYTINSKDNPPFDKNKLEVWDWTGVSLNKESQTDKKYTDSIQYRVIQKSLEPTHDPYYDIVYDDDGSYEAADVVAIKIAGEKLLVDLFHCKFKQDGIVGARVEDLYVVCGQAQRSVHWKGNIKGLFEHLRYRESLRMQSTSVSRFERGDLIKLNEIAKQTPFLVPEFRIYAIQPGYSKAKAKTNHLNLFASTEVYLKDTYDIKFGVIINK